MCVSVCVSVCVHKEGFEGASQLFLGADKYYRLNVFNNIKLSSHSPAG
jgi:hypothetical protein